MEAVSTGVPASTDALVVTHQGPGAREGKLWVLRCLALDFDTETASSPDSAVPFASELHVLPSPFPTEVYCLGKDDLEIEPTRSQKSDCWKLGDGWKCVETEASRVQSSNQATLGREARNRRFGSDVPGRVEDDLAAFKLWSQIS